MMMLVSLFTFRELLKYLGVDDYGTYNVVAGVVVLFSFLSNAMTQSNQRFLSFHLGRGDTEALKRTFSMIINIQILISLIIIVIAETLGLWFINTQMNFDGVDMKAVNWLYQFTILSFIIQIFQIPYTSSIIAHEKMSFFSYFSIVDALLRLGAVLLLGLFSSGRLIAYGAFLSVATFLVFLGYKIYVQRTFSVCRYERLWDKSLFKTLTSFCGWNMLTGIGNIAGMQGVSILCNIYYGVVVNAAMGVSHQVSVTINSLTSGVSMAVTPPIIKACSSNNIPYFNSLIYRSTRVLLFMVAVFGIPIYINADFLLHLWLTDVPEYAVCFAQWSVLYFIVDTISNPLWVGIQAYGKIRVHAIVISALFFLNLPLSFIAVKMGFSPVSVVIIRFFINVAMLLFRLVYMKSNFEFSILNYLNNAGRYILQYALVALAITICFIYVGEDISPWMTLISSFLLLVSTGYFLLFTSSERVHVKTKVSSFIASLKSK